VPRQRFRGQTATCPSTPAPPGHRPAGTPSAAQTIQIGVSARLSRKELAWYRQTSSSCASRAPKASHGEDSYNLGQTKTPHLGLVNVPVREIPGKNPVGRRVVRLERRSDAGVAVRIECQRPGTQRQAPAASSHAERYSWRKMRDDDIAHGMHRMDKQTH
jgi:hypothetical protein